MNPQLHQIADLIKSRRFDQARQELEHYLEQRPEDASAWYLRSFVEPSRDRKFAAAKHALTLDPGNDRLQTRLADLFAIAPDAHRRKRRLLAAVVAIVVIAVVATAFIALQSGSSTDAPLPTLAVLPMPTAGIAPTELAVELNDVPEDRVTEITPTDLPVSLEATVIVQGATTVNSPSPDVPQVSPVEMTSTIVTENAPIEVIPTTSSINLPSGDSTPTLPQRPTRGGSTPSVASPTPTSIAATPVFGSITDNGVSVNTAVNIGTGEMRVVDVIRPAEGRIAELGGSVPNAPSDQAWVLVEVLLICTGEQNCMSNSSTLWIIGSSGAVYSASPQLNLTPIFGSVLSNRQMWGYLGFIVPRNEDVLRLLLWEVGQNYVFRLQ